MDTSELERRLQALEPLRREAGAVAKAVTLARLWGLRMGGMFVLALALSMGAVWAGLEGEQIAPWAVAAAAAGFIVPTIAGLAWVLPATWRVIGGHGASDAAYLGPLREQVLRPLLQTAVPAIAIDFEPVVDLAALDRRGLYGRRLQDMKHRATLQVSGLVQGHAWTAVALRVWEVRAADSNIGNSNTRIVTAHDGLVAWLPLPGRHAAPLRVADRATAERVLARRSPVSTLLGRAPAAFETGDAEFDRRFTVLSDPPEPAALPAPLRRALCAAHDALGAPLRLAFGPDGVAVALHERGRFAGVESSAQVLELLRWQSAAQTVAARAAALRADADLLARLPAVLASLARAL